MKLSKVIEKIEDNARVQYLATDCVNIKDKKKTADTEITFATTEVDCHSWMTGNKTALIVWVDRDEFNSAMQD